MSGRVFSVFGWLKRLRYFQSVESRTLCHLSQTHNEFCMLCDLCRDEIWYKFLNNLNKVILIYIGIESAPLL